MWLIDLILNLAALLLWIKWLEHDVSSAISEPRISVVANLRRASPRQSRLIFLAALLSLLLARGFFYWVLGSATQWTPKIYFGPVLLYFRSDFFGRILLYSFFSFGAALAVFYISLLLFTIVNPSLKDDTVQKGVRAQLGRIDGWPLAARLLLPWFLALVLWCLLHPVFRKIGILPASKSFLQILQQGAIVGLGVYLVWKYVLSAVLLLYVLNSYIYFGNWPLWKFIENTGRQILKPLGRIPLRAGRIDFAPVVALAVVIVSAEYASRGLIWLYQRALG